MKCPKCGGDMRRFKIGYGVICKQCRFTSTPEEMKKIIEDHFFDDHIPILKFNRIDKIVIKKDGWDIYSRNQIEKPYIDKRLYKLE